MHLGKKLASGGNLDRVTALKHSATRVNGDLKIEGRCVVGGVPISGVAAQSDGSGGSDDSYAPVNHHEQLHDAVYAPRQPLANTPPHYSCSDPTDLNGTPITVGQLRDAYPTVELLLRTMLQIQT